MRITGGVLLEHLARLATHGAACSAAMVDVAGRRKEDGSKSVSHGMTPPQVAAVRAIDEILASGPLITVVPDLSLDPRFATQAKVFESPRLRFLVHARLLSPGGERIGFICLLHEEPLPGLTRQQREALGHIAGVVLADRQKDQRHLHLMQVAERALRVDRMLRLVSDAVSCADALTNLLEELCQFHGAAVGQIWQLVRPDQPLVEVSRHHHADAGRGACPVTARPALDRLTLETIRRNKPHALRRSHLEEIMDIGSNLASHVCVPVWVQQQRFGISLAFTDDNAELDSVVADISALGDSIRPTLFQKVTEERIRFAAHHDDLTQLSNRVLFQERLRKAIAQAESGGQTFALLYLDLDGFKLINDTRGHEIGDRLLVSVARRLRDSVREVDTVARMGGDEFAIIQPIDNQPSAAIMLARRLVETVTRPFDLAGRQALIGVSIGIALYPRDGESPDVLLRNADHALYRAKNSGRKTFRLYDPAMEFNQPEHFIVEQDLRDAISRDEFTLAYQPVRDTKAGRIIGFEALLRWNHPVIGQVPPDQFIPLAESSGLIVPLGRWALETACAEAATWDPPVFLSVNLSPLQFRQPDLPREIAEVLNRADLPPTRLRLEVTEGLLLDESALVLRTMRALQEQGIQMILDDFGTAYASLSYLRRFPFDGIKIDKSFVQGLCNDETTLAIVQVILSLGDRLNLAVVAEGVETEHELFMVGELGCRFFQGFLGGRPADGAAARELLRQMARDNPPSSRSGFTWSVEQAH